MGNKGLGGEQIYGLFKREGNGPLMEGRSAESGRECECGLEYPLQPGLINTEGLIEGQTVADA